MKYIHYYIDHEISLHHTNYVVFIYVIKLSRLRLQYFYILQPDISQFESCRGKQERYKIAFQFGSDLEETINSSGFNVIFLYSDILGPYTNGSRNIQGYCGLPEFVGYISQNSLFLS